MCICTTNVQLHSFITDVPLKYGSREELQIRCCSLFAIKKLCEKVKETINNVKKQRLYLQCMELTDVPVLVDNVLMKKCYLLDVFIHNEPFIYCVKNVYY